MYGHGDECRLAEQTAHGRADVEQCKERRHRAVNHHSTGEVERDADERADTRRDDGRLAADAVRPGAAAEHQHAGGRRVDDQLVAEQVQRRGRLDADLDVGVQLAEPRAAQPQ